MIIRPALWVMLTFAGCIIGCDGDKGPAEPEGPTEPAAPTRLFFTVQPFNATAGDALAPSVQVVLQDASGKTVTTAVGEVTVTLGSNPGGGTLLGVTTVNVVRGVASFDDLAIDRASSGYTLVARSGSLTEATSVPFAVAPGEKATLAFLVQRTP